MDEVATDPRWRGQPGRLEVWYATATDRSTGTGIWLHHERVAPTEALGRPAYAHGWVAVFPPDGPPTVARFGPEPVPAAPAADRSPPRWLTIGSVECGPEVFRGEAGELSWGIRVTGLDPPIWTMPRKVWSRELLPAAQVVTTPRAEFRGWLTHPDGQIMFDGVGDVAHIYGHGNAHQWAWLHADLDDTTTLEIVTAVGRRRILRRLPPLAFVQLRRDGLDWPLNSLAAAPLFRTRLGLPNWQVQGIVGNRRLSVSVHQPPGHCVTLDYVDPDGSQAICVNTEVADVHVKLERLAGLRPGWRTDGEWSLRGTAHAERGYRS